MEVARPTKVGEYSGWEIFTAAPGSYSIRRAEQRVGPFASIEEAKQAIDLEQGKLERADARQQNGD